MDAGVFESAPVQSPPGSHHRPGAHHRDRNRVLSFPQNAGGTAEKESLVAFRASTELSRGRDSGRRPFLGAPSRLSSDRTGGSVISTLEEKDSYDVGGAKSDGHGGAESSCQKHVHPNEKHGVLWNQYSHPATTLSEVIQHSKDFPDYNVAVSSHRGVGNLFFWDVDCAGVIDQAERETGQIIPPTFTVQSRPQSAPWKQHRYFRGTPYSLERL